MVSRLTCFELKNLKIYLSDDSFTLPSDVGFILNVARECSSYHPGIKYTKIPIDDNYLSGLDHQLLDQVIEEYRDFNKTNTNPDSNKKAILVHCGMGINRSGAATAAILWYTNGRAPVSKWYTPEEMITWMRTEQRKARYVGLLMNPTMYDSVIEWCKKYT
jgi:hypothetical protein